MNSPGSPSLTDVTILVSPEPWSALPTNKHQIARRLAAEGKAVYYVDWNGASVVSWVKGRFKVFGSEKDGVAQVCPPRLPIRLTRRSPFVLTLDSLLKSLILICALRKARIGAGLVITYVPLSYIFVRTLQKHHPVLYHCVDDIGSFPEWEKSASCRDLVYRSERRLVRAAEVTMCSSEALYDKCTEIVESVVYWPNAGDFSLFSRAATIRSDCPQEFIGLERPIVFFHGNLVEHKIDFELIVHLAKCLTAGTVVLLGPIEPNLADALLAKVPEGALVLLPAASQEVAVSYIQHVDMLLLPYVQSTHTRSVFPLKVMEYLATGIPIASVPLPSIVTACGGNVAFCSSAIEVVAELNNLDDLRSTAMVRQAIASANSWESRMRDLEALARHIDARRG